MTPDEKLDAIAAAYETFTKNADGSWSSTHARHNLDGALIDMSTTGEADQICLNTVRRVRDQLAEIEKFISDRLPTP